jgi:hypothetical protein
MREGLPARAGFEFAHGWHPDVAAKTRRAFELEALIAAFDSELAAIFFTRPDEAPRTRNRYGAALVRIVEFMGATGFSDTVRGELVELAAALDELDSGIVRHFLQPTKWENRGADSSDIWVARAMVAIAADLAIESGDSRKGVAREIARQQPLLGPLLQGRAESLAGAVESWHRLFLADRIKSDVAREVFRHRQDFANDVIGKPVANASVSERGDVYRNAMAHAIFLACRSATPELAAEMEAQIKRGQTRSPCPR